MENKESVLNEEEPALEKFRRHDSKLVKSFLESSELQNEIKQCLTMKDVPEKDIEIDEQR